MLITQLHRFRDTGKKNKQFVYIFEGVILIEFPVLCTDLVRRLAKIIIAT